MDDPVDKQWASKYVLDPLTAPEPSQETGPGSHFIPRHKKTASSSSSTYPTPPTSASPNRASFSPSNPYSPSYRQQLPGNFPKEASTKRRSAEVPTGEAKKSGHLRRGSSLSERFPGDMSHRPLDQLRREAKTADRSPHLKKRHIPGTDIIDNLDKTVLGGTYHHGGPYDATLLARNTSYQSSPVAAVKETNAEALKATPKEYVQDSIRKHVPLQGTAIIAPGAKDLAGREMQYEEGTDMMRETGMVGGEYKRWPGMKYHPDDLKGKGEPSYSIERALKEQKNNASSHKRVISDGNESYEMQNRLPSSNGIDTDLAGTSNATGGEIRRSNTTGRKVGESLKRRLGSLRRSKRSTDV